MDNLHAYVWDHVLQQRHKELMCEAETDRLVREIRASQRKARAAKAGTTVGRIWPRAELGEILQVLFGAVGMRS